jgi:hypothetical protein
MSKRQRLSVLDRLAEGLGRSDRLPALPPDSQLSVREAELYPLDEADEEESIYAIMGGAERKGSWEPAARISAIAFWGGIKLDFRDADLLEGRTVVDALAIMGGVEVIVPPDIDVETAGSGFMGGFSHLSQRAPQAGAPCLRIEGLAVMGGVEVKVQGPDKKRKRRR